MSSRGIVLALALLAAVPARAEMTDWQSLISQGAQGLGQLQQALGQVPCSTREQAYDQVRQLAASSPVAGYLQQAEGIIKQVKDSIPCKSN